VPVRPAAPPARRELVFKPGERTDARAGGEQNHDHEYQWRAARASNGWRWGRDEWVARVGESRTCSAAMSAIIKQTGQFGFEGCISSVNIFFCDSGSPAPWLFWRFRFRFRLQFRCRRGFLFCHSGFLVFGFRQMVGLRTRWCRIYDRGRRCRLGKFGVGVRLFELLQPIRELSNGIAERDELIGNPICVIGDPLFYALKNFDNINLLGRV